MQTQEVLFEDMPAWIYYAHRTGSTSAEVQHLLHSTRTHIARMYLHKLVS